MKWYPGKVMVALLYILFSLPFVVFGNSGALEASMAAQSERMTALRAVYSDEAYAPVNESAVTGFNVEKAVADGVKFNEVAYIGTHNSYQLAADDSYAQIYRKLSDATFGLVSDQTADYNSETLTEQFNTGIRSIELDIETRVIDGKASFICTHEPGFNMNSSCADFALALEEIKLWSENNPGHLPITVIIEPKKVFIPVNDTVYFNPDYALELDSLLREALGSTLLTPADMLGSYSDFAAMRNNNGWLPLGDTLGKVLVLLHDTTITSSYINADKTIKTQAMFPMLRYSDRDKSYASFLLLNDSSDALVHAGELVDNGKFIVRTRADSFGYIDEDERAAAIKSGAQIISTDYPPRSDGQYEENTLTFGNRATVRTVQNPGS